MERLVSHHLAEVAVEAKLSGSREGIKVHAHLDGALGERKHCRRAVARLQPGLSPGCRRAQGMPKKRRNPILGAQVAQGGPHVVWNLRGLFFVPWRAELPSNFVATFRNFVATSSQLRGNFVATSWQLCSNFVIPKFAIC